MFISNSEDVDYIFEALGREVLVNGKATNVITTNPPISEYEERYIHTLQNVSRGSMVTLEGEGYLVISETVTKRHGKFKSLIRHCNYIIDVQGDPTLVDTGLKNDFGEPIYETVPGQLYKVPAIVDNKSFSVDKTSAIRVPEKQIIVTVQDNQINRDYLNLNDTFTFEGSYKVLNCDFTKKGLIILTCERPA